MILDAVALRRGWSRERRKKLETETEGVSRCVNLTEQHLHICTFARSSDSFSLLAQSPEAASDPTHSSRAALA